MYVYWKREETKMKKIKSLAVIATCTAALLLLAGCDITQEMTINDDLTGKAKITMEQAMSKSDISLLVVKMLIMQVWR